MNCEVSFRVAEHLRQAKNKGHDVFYIALYGSQNYELENEMSDVDTKAMIVPSLEDVFLGKQMVSYDFKVDEELCNVKDFRLMLQNFKKGNINFVEILYSRYYFFGDGYADKVRYLRAHRELFGSQNPFRLMEMASGMAKQKYVAFCKPFESKKAILEKYGYDPKQLHHLVRLYYFMRTYMSNGESFGDSLVPTQDQKDYLLGLKKSPLPFEAADKLREEYMARVDCLREQAKEKYSTPDWQTKIKSRGEEVDSFIKNLTLSLLYDKIDREVRE